MMTDDIESWLTDVIAADSKPAAEPNLSMNVRPSDKVCTHVEWNLSTHAMDIDESNDEFESQTKLVKEGIEDLSLFELQSQAMVYSTTMSAKQEQEIGGEVCITHGDAPPLKRRLSQLPRSLSHGAKVKLCTYKGEAPCTKQAKKDGLCTAHWMEKNVYDENGEDFSLIELPPLEQTKTHLRPIKTAEEVLPKGVTFRPSGKWQVQLFYAGQSRYLGMFPSKEAAAMAYELARVCAIQLGDDWRTWKKLSPEQIKANVVTLRKAAAQALMTIDNIQKQAIRVHRIVPKKSEEKPPIVVVDDAFLDDAFLLLFFASHSVLRQTRVESRVLENMS
jgi:hypothetical protein